MVFALLCLAFVCAFGQQHRVLRVYSSDLRAGRMDPLTAQLTGVIPMPMPNTTCKGWETGEGTRGQDSAIFYVNQTFFFVAREKDCEAPTVARTFLMATMGPFDKFIRVYPMAMLRSDADLASLNMGWDHTCNVVVSYPTGHHTFAVDQVSEYDGAQRMQPSFTIAEGWKKVPGLGGVDFGNFRPSWLPGKELNCGDECLFYSLEQKIDPGTGGASFPRFFVGRSFREGKVMFNATDSLNAQTLSFNPFLYKNNQFIGIGICCSDTWCHPDCKNYKEGNMVLFGFTPSSGFTIFADIGETDKDSIRLGIEFSPAPYSSMKEKQAYVIHKNSVIAWNLGVDEKNFVVKAERGNVSPPIDSSFLPLRYWANAMN